MPDKLRELVTTFRTQLLTDKKKSAVLGVLFLVFVIAVGRLFVGRSTPETVTAEMAVPVVNPAPIASTPPDRQAPMPERLRNPTQSPNGGLLAEAPGGSVDLMANTIGLPSGIAWDPRHAVSVTAMDRSLKRDLFTTRAWSKFAPAWTTTQSADEESSRRSRQKEGIWDKLLKEANARFEQQRKQREEIENELAAMTLQATMTGETPTAYISGEFVRIGTRIRKFEVVSISDRRVVLRRNGSNFDLTMH